MTDVLGFVFVTEVVYGGRGVSWTDLRVTCHSWSDFCEVHFDHLAVICCI